MLRFNIMRVDIVELNVRVDKTSELLVLLHNSKMPNAYFFSISDAHFC